MGAQPVAGWGSSEATSCHGSTVTADQRTEWTYTEALAAATTMATSLHTVPTTGAGT
jgi:hypothetical protein